VKHLVVILILLAALAPSELFAKKSAPRDLEWYQKRGVTIVTLDEASPMSYTGYNGKPKGHLIDFWTLWSRKTGIPVTFHHADWQVSLNAMRIGTYDIHAGLFYTKGRNAYLDFTEPFHPLQAAILVLKSMDVELKQVLADYTLGVLEDGYTENYLNKNYPKTRIMAYSNIAKIVEALQKGEIQGLAGDHPIMGYEASKRGFGQNLVIKKILYTQDLRGGITKGNPALLEIVNQGMASITSEEREMLVNRWFMAEESSTNWLWNLLLIVSILVTAIITLMILDRRKTGTTSLEENETEE
jgi:ABC-type amino acid transport substrate-binding protein